MRGIIKSLHTYAGLLTFVNLMVYGVAGFSSLFHVAPDEMESRVPQVSERPFTVPPNLTDKQVAGRIAADLGLRLALPVQDFVISHDTAGRLKLDFWHVNGRHRVVVLEQESRIRVEQVQVPISNYLSNLHGTTAAFRGDDWRMMSWAYYNEFAMWCLAGMILSGVYLWLATRPRHTLALASLAAGTGVFAVLYVVTR